MNKFLVLLVLVFLGSCRHRVAVPEDQSFYMQGLDAFRKATPEGYERATAAFRRAASLNPSRCEYALSLAESLLFLAEEQRLNWENFLPRVSEATAIADSVESKAECSTFASYLARVRAVSLAPHFQTGRKEQALTWINLAIELAPREPMNWVVLAHLDSADPRMPALRALELAPDLALVQSVLGQYYLDSENYNEASRAFTRAVEISPRHFRSHTALGYIANLDYRPDAEALYLKAVNIGPAFLGARTLLGGFYAGIGMDEKAVEQYRTAISLNAQYYPALIGLGRTLIYAGRLAEAEKPLRQVVELNPMEPPLAPERAVAVSNAHYLLGHIGVVQENVSAAKTEFQEALKASRNVDAMSALGAVYYREGDLDKALSQYENVIQFQKSMKVPVEFPDAYLYRGAIREAHRQFPEALGDYTHAIEVYERQIADLRTQAEKSESMSLRLKVEMERRQRAELESQLRSARQFKERAQGQR